MQIPSIPEKLKPRDPRFGVGPSLIPVEHLERLAATGTKLMGTSHRQSAVKNLVKDIQERMRDYFGLAQETEILLGNGGATLLWDMIGLGIVEKKSRHFTCGEFSQKWYKAHANIPWIDAEEISVDFGQGISPDTQDEDLNCLILNETSTGVQNIKLPEVDRSKTLIAMDATSGAGQIEVDLAKIDLFYFSPQKVFAGEGGLFFCFASPEAIARAEKIEKDTNRYLPVIMSWKLAIENSQKHQTYNTPGVAGLFLVQQQLKKMQSLGFKKVCLQGKEKADLVYQWAESKDYLSCFVDSESRSQTVATIDVDSNIPVDDILKNLREQNIVYDIDAYRKLGRNQFRIGMFHNIEKSELEKLTQLLSFIIES